MMKFINETADEHKPYTAVSKIVVELQAGDLALPEVLQAFKDFLLASGYSINGDIVVETSEPDAEV